MKRTKTLFTCLVLALLLLLSVPSLYGSIFPECEYCYDGGPENSPGQCQTILTAGPAIDSMSNCVGTLLCFPFLGGAFCRPSCLGDPCYWV